MVKIASIAICGFLAGSYPTFLVAKQHLVEKSFGSPVGLNELADSLPHYRRSAFDIDFDPSLDQKLFKRGLYNLTGNNDADTSILTQAYIDMRTVVDYVAQNPNPGAMARYFHPNDFNDVTAIFTTVSRMAAPGGFPNPPIGIVPTDLNRIKVRRTNGGIGFGGIALAQSFNTIASPTNPNIQVYNLGWGSLWQRLLSDVRCDRDVTKVNYKLHILGTLLLHETLHFNAVPNLAWVATGGQALMPNACLDDQPGSWLCPLLNTHKAYGPWEAMKLLNRNAAMAKLNIENYVWYALETFWLHQCPNAPRGPGGLLTAAKDNDIPASCKQGAKGVGLEMSEAWKNVWCWQ